MLEKIDSETALTDEKTACGFKYGLKSNTVLMQSSRTFRILGYLNVLGHFNSEIKTVIQTAWKKVHILKQKILKIYLSKVLTGRCNYM